MKKAKKLLVLISFLLLAVTCLALVSCGDFGEDKNRITVTYYWIDGEPPEVETIYKGDTFGFYGTPTRSHYTFLGLFDEQGSKIVDEYGQGTVALTESVTLYARWTPATYTIKFNTDEEDATFYGSTESFEATYGNAFSNQFPLAEKLGYEFLGWFSGNTKVADNNGFVDGANVFTSNYYEFADDGPLTLVPKFDVKMLDVVFDFNDNETPQKTIQVQYGYLIPEEEIPESDTGDKMIVGWTAIPNSLTIFEGEVTQDLTLYPIWKRYKVVNFYTSVDDDEPEKSEKVFEGEPLTPYTPERPGYDFDGWYKTKHLTGIPETAIQYAYDTTDFYAKWNLAYYQLSFVTNNGTTLDIIEYTILSELDLPELTKENFTFIGWCKEEDLSDDPVTEIVEGTYGITTMYAKYKGDDKQVVLNAGVGTLSASEQTVEYYAKYTLPIPSCDGYEFQGWFTGEDDGAIRLTDKEGVSLEIWDVLDESTTVYAQYKQKYYVNVSVNMEEAGSFEVNEYYVKGDKVKLTATVEDGYKILGWYKNDSLVSSKANYEFTMGEADVYLELRFEPKKYVLTLDAGEGICKTETVTVEYGANYELPIAYKQGKLFLGWEYEGELITDEGGVGLAPWKLMVGNVTLVASYCEDEIGATMISDLQGFLDMINDPAGYYVLVEDINLSGVNWVPFEFKGTLLGNGCVVKNLRIESSSGNLGMFTKITGTVKDLKLENVSIVSTSYESVLVGGLCAELAGGSVSGIEVKGKITGDYCRIGGIVGKMTGGSLKNCKNYATISSETYESAVSAGGIVSMVDSGEVSGCKNYGAISIGYHCGGVIGVSYTNTISELENYGSVTGKNQIGGVIGLFEKAGSFTINALKNSGVVKGEENVGGVVGKFLDAASWDYNNSTYNLKLVKFVNTAKVTGTVHVGGCIGYLSTYIDGYKSSASIITVANGFENKADIKGTRYVGGLIGYAYSDNGSSTVANAKSSGTIEAESYIGGLAGRLENIRLIDSTNVGTTVKATYYYLDGSTYYAYVGGYVGYGYYVENCNNAIPITYEEAGIYVGGIAGRLLYTIKNCTNTANVKAEKASYVGGLVGELTCAGNYDIVKLTNSGAVSGTDYVGGVFGTVINSATWDYNSSTYNLKISKIVNSGAVTGANQVGGCIGRIYVNINGYKSEGASVKIIANDIENTANVQGTRYVGGLIGYAYSDNGSSQISSSKSSGAITAESYVGGLAGQLENIRLVGSSNAGATVSATQYYLDGSTYYAYVGGYVGYGYYIENCHNAVEITYAERGMYVGGIAGRTLNAIKNCSNTANIKADKASYVGGIIGELTCAGSYEITELKNSGAITGVDYVGGIFGTVTDNATWDYNDSTYSLKINKLSNTGAVTGANQVAGCIGRIYVNISGYSSDGSVIITANGIENTANVIGKQYVGGIIGYAYSDNGASQLSSSKSSGAITAESYIGGLAGRLENVKLIESSNEGSTVSATNYAVDGTNYYVYVGGYVGYGYYIENCHNAVEITYAERGMFVGGIAGRTLNAIKNCSNTANIKADKANYVGGLVGELTCTGSYELTELTNSGAVTGVDYVGGIFGTVTDNATWDYNDSTYHLKINKITNSGAVAGSNQVAGCIGRIYVNISGYSSDGSVIITANMLENTANVIGKQYVGGLIGYASSDNGSSQIANSNSSGEITAECYVGGLAGQLSNVKLIESSNEGSKVTATSYLVDNTNYYAYLGGYVGYGYYVENCHNAVDISYSHEAMFVGGVAGQLSNPIKNSSNTATVYAPNASYVGGIVGEVYCLGTYEISDMVNSGNVTGKNQVGGIIGKIYNCNNGASYNDTHYTMKLTRFNNSGAVAGNSNVGGCIGYVYTSVTGYSSDGSVVVIGNDIDNSGNVTGVGTVAGLIGEVYTDNGGSQLTDYECTGLVNGVSPSSVSAEELKTLLIKVKTNFSIQ